MTSAGLSYEISDQVAVLRLNRPAVLNALDPALLTQLMDENARSPQPQDAAHVMREALVTSAVGSARRAEELGLPAQRIVLSCKVSGVQDLIAVYTELARRCDYPLHLGLTEAGMGSKGIVASTAAMAVLLQSGIGDTIRVSLSADPVEEIKVGYDLLKSLGLRRRGVTIIFVSHSPVSIRSLCRRVCVLEQGEMVFDGGLMCTSRPGLSSSICSLNRPSLTSSVRSLPISSQLASPLKLVR